MGEVNLWWIALHQQILDTDVDEFIHSRPGQKQRLDHQCIFALAAVGDLNQTFNFAVFQPGDGAVRMRGGASANRRRTRSTTYLV
jgi:hypothetical protein